MADYIEREKVFKDLLDQCKIMGYGGLIPNDIKYVFSLQTNADVKPVVRGEWIDEPVYKQTMSGKTYDGFTYCSNCKYDFSFGYRSKFCPNCGADMRGEDDV